MPDLFSKIFGIFLGFVLMVLAPFTIASMVDDMIARRGIMNEMRMFIDEVIDTRYITEEQLADFQLGVSSYGQLVSVKIERYVKTVDPDPKTGGTYTTYVYADNNMTYNQGDHIKVTIKTIGYTGVQKLVMGTIGLMVPDFECTFAGRVR